MNTASRGASLTKAPGCFPPRPGDHGLESVARSRLSALLQATAAGLQMEAAAYAAGLRDGEEGADFRPLEDWSPERLIQLVRSGDQAGLSRASSYMHGYQRGRQFSTKGGAREHEHAL